MPAWRCRGVQGATGRTPPGVPGENGAFIERAWTGEVERDGGTCSPCCLPPPAPASAGVTCPAAPAGAPPGVKKRRRLKTGLPCSPLSSFTHETSSPSDSSQPPPCLSPSLASACSTPFSHLNSRGVWSCLGRLPGRRGVPCASSTWPPNCRRCQDLKAAEPVQGGLSEGNQSRGGVSERRGGGSDCWEGGVLSPGGVGGAAVPAEQQQQHSAAAAVNSSSSSRRPLLLTRPGPLPAAPIRPCCGRRHGPCARGRSQAASSTSAGGGVGVLESAHRIPLPPLLIPCCDWTTSPPPLDCIHQRLLPSRIPPWTATARLLRLNMEGLVLVRVEEFH